MRGRTQTCDEAVALALERIEMRLDGVEGHLSDLNGTLSNHMTEYRDELDELSATNPLVEPVGKAPWNPSVFWPLAIFCGFGAAGVLAGLNYRRMGRPELTWPTIGVSVAAFVGLYIGLAFVELEALAWLDLETSAWLPFVINVPPALILERLQRSDYERTKACISAAEGGGWGVPIMIGVTGILVTLVLVFAVPRLTTDVGLDEVTLQFNRGAELFDQGEYRQATEPFSEAIRLNPKFTQAYYNRAVTYVKLEQYQRAIQDFDEAIRLDPQLAVAYTDRGFAYLNLDQYQRAIPDFSDAIRLDPQYARAARAYLGRGMAYAVQDKKAEARADLEKAIALTDDPQFLQLARELIDLLSQ